MDTKHEEPPHTVILSEAKNLGSDLDRSTNGDDQRCLALLNMTAICEMNSSTAGFVNDTN